MPNMFQCVGDMVQSMWLLKLRKQSPAFPTSCAYLPCMKSFLLRRGTLATARSSDVDGFPDAVASRFRCKQLTAKTVERSRS